MSHRQPRSPLEGLRILDLTTFLSGPFGTQILADLGADVVKIEPPQGDSSRSIPPHFIDGDSAYFHSANRGKRSVVLDLKTEQDQDVVRALAGVADVVVENFRPGVLGRLGLTHEDVSAANPGVVWCSISGFGQYGPYRDRPAYDMVVQAMSGAMSLTGMPGGPAVRSGIPIGDLAAGMYAVIGILAALHQRAATGTGRVLDIAMLDCLVGLLSYQGAYHLLAGVEPGRQGRGHDSIPTYRAFAGADGDELMVTANTEPMWRSLCEVLGRRELAADPRFVDGVRRQNNRVALAELLEEAFRARPASDWLHPLLAAGVPVAPVNSVASALNDEHTRARDMVIQVEPRGSGAPLTLLGTPVKFTDSGHRPQHLPPPQLGHHNHGVLADWLGRSRHEETTSKSPNQESDR